MKSPDLVNVIEQFIDGLPDAAIAIDSDGKVIASNSSLLTILGFEKNEVVSKTVSSLPFLTNSSRVQASEFFQVRMSGGEVKPYSLDFLTKGGEYKSGTVYGEKIHNEALGINIDIALVKILSEKIRPEDIKDLQNAQKALKESEERYKFLVNSSDEYILIVSLSGKIIYANQATINNFGFSEEEIIGKSITSFLAPQSASQVGPAIINSFMGKNPGKFDIYTKVKTGGFRIVENNSKALRFINSGGMKGLLIFGRDITEQRKAEEENKKSQAQILAKNKELEDMNKLMIGRELKMVELKKQLDDLKKSTSGS